MEAKDEGKRYRTEEGGGGGKAGGGGVKKQQGERMRMKHRVYRVPGFPSSRPNWVLLTTPSPASDCCSHPPLGPRGEIHLLAGEGMGGPNSDEGADTLVLLY